MTRGAAMDTRAFRWPLAVMLRKIDIQAQAAQIACAAAQGREQAAHAQVEQARKEQSRHAGDVVAGLRDGFDARRHAQGLQFLLQGAFDVEERRQRHAAAQRAGDEARAACLRQELQRAALRALEEAALRAFGAEQARRQAREADLAWLARRDWRPPMRPGEETA